MVIPGWTKHLLFWPFFSVVLYSVARINYLQFHGLAEIFCVIIVVGIYMTAWNARRVQRSHFLLFLGFTYLFVGLFVTMHALSFTGMGEVAAHNDNPWFRFLLAARYLEGVCWLLAPVLLGRRPRLGLLVVGYSLFVLLLISCLLPPPFLPVSWLGSLAHGRFWLANEYGVCAIFLAAAVFLFFWRARFERDVFLLFFCSLTLSILAELAHIYAISIFGVTNLLDHLLKIGAYYLIYKAIIETGLMRPYDLLSRDLKHSESQYRSIFNNAPLAFVLWDGDCLVTDWNKQAEEMFGWHRDEVLGRNFFEFLIPAETRPQVADVVKSLLENSLPNQSINENLTKDGRIIICEWNNSIRYDRNGRLVGAISLGLDITEQQRAAATLQRSSAETRWLAYSVSHDLKTPAVCLQGLTKRLCDRHQDDLGEEGRRYCQQILKGADQITALVDKVNVYIRAKEMALHVEPIDLQDICRTIREEFWPQLRSRGLNWQAPDNLPAIRADRLALLRALRNLVDNALKYGGVDLTTIELGYAEDVDSHILSVGDDGVGMKDKDMERIFGAFTRQESSSGIEGTGLGLAIVKEIAKQHGGMVQARPRPARGMIFFFTISKQL
ncbi:MAG: hypothetical protein A2521_08125 [Deltaproteobacteria bacterium RIFOXYD12_FULL_57_12]|nr:MAG: hypothetical protein A2521_08125 [Deltaproteobacteria bacterium RIFOXYD12_FULL_57_12]